MTWPCLYPHERDGANGLFVQHAFSKVVQSCASRTLVIRPHFQDVLPLPGDQDPKVTKFHIKTGISVTLCHLWGVEATLPRRHYRRARLCRSAMTERVREGFIRGIRVSKIIETNKEHVAICQVRRGGCWSGFA
jgi:hypothetical protein